MRKRAFCEIVVGNSRVRICSIAEFRKPPELPGFVEVRGKVTLQHYGLTRCHSFWIWDFNCTEPTNGTLAEAASDGLRWLISLLKDALEERTDVLSRICKRADLYCVHDIRPTPIALYALWTAGEIAKGIGMALDAILVGLRRSDGRKQLIKLLETFKPNTVISLNGTKIEAKEAVAYGD